MHKHLLRAALLGTLIAAPWAAQAQASSDLSTLPPQQINHVPEPGSLATSALAIGIAITLRRRRKG